MEEWIDLYDGDGKPLNRLHRRGDPAEPGTYWRVCDIWLIDRSNRFLLQKRSGQKREWPGKWCCTGGFIRHGESREEGCRRECLEELGFVPNDEDGGRIFEYVSSRSIHDVYLYRTGIALDNLKLQADEVSDAKYVSIEEFQSMIEHGEVMPEGYFDQLFNMLPILLSNV